MFTVTLPYEKGTFVKIINPLYERKQPIEIGTVTGYGVFSENDITVYISGHKESWFGDYLLSEVDLMTEDEITEVIK